MELCIFRTSIICIGSQTSDVKNGDYSENFTHWAKIIGDKKEYLTKYIILLIYRYDGLIFNVKCH